MQVAFEADPEAVKQRQIEDMSGYPLRRRGQTLHLMQQPKPNVI